MRYWRLDRPTTSGQLDLSHVTGLVAAIGYADATSFAAEVLKTLVEALAPLIGHAARHHYALHGQSQLGIPQLMLARVRSLCPALAKRELDVVRGVLEGRTAVEISELLGIKPASVVTYQKRAYQR